MGTIGGGPCFVIGDQENFVADTGGELMLGINDSWFVDNYGYLVATIIVVGSSTAAPNMGGAATEDRGALRVYPNPSTDGAEIRFALRRDTRVSLAVYDVAGRRIAEVLNEFRPAGDHHAYWDGRTTNGVRAAVGSYFVSMKTENGSEMRKLVQIR
jgi:hypothetical protein